MAYLLPTDDAPVKTLQKSFAGQTVTVNPLDTSKAGSLQLSKVAEEQIIFGNPAFILANKADLQAQQKEWETVSKPTGFVEFIGEGFLNLGAGVVNAIVPGSNLGDQNNPSNFVGSIAGAFLSPSIISAATKLTDMSFISSAFDFVNKAFSGPVGALSSNLINSYVTSQFQPIAAQAAAFSAPTAQNITESKSAPAQAAAFGNTGQEKFVGVTASTGKAATEKPSWFWWAVGGAVALVVGFMVWMIRKK